MRKKVRRSLALLLALTMMVTLVKSEELFVSAKSSISEQVSSDTEETVQEEAEVSRPETEAASEGAQAEAVPAEETAKAGGTAEEALPEETPSEETLSETAQAPADETEGAKEEVTEEVPGTSAEENTADEGMTPAEEGTAPDAEAPTEEKQPDGETPSDAEISGEDQTPSETEVSEGELPTDETEIPAAEEEKPSEGIEEQPEDTKTEETKTEETELMEYIPEEQPEGISVKAYAEKGVLPENVQMSVTALTEEGDTSDQYSEAIEALENSKVEYDGFVAYDISFLDEDGNEIEPEDGSVQVKFELDTGVLPEGADTETLAVQHLAETEDGVEVQTVADATDETEGTVKVKKETVKADFTVDSFSTFLVTYSDGIQALANNLSTVTTVDSRSLGVTIDAFDYTGSNNNSGINANHRFKFTGGAIEEDVLNRWTGHNGGSGVLQGILQSKLSGGYPVLSSTYGGESLNYLFNSNRVNGKTSYRDLNHLFLQSAYENGKYFEYDSSKNFATLADDNDTDFTVYSVATSDTAKFMPFNDLDNWGRISGTKNYHFGMHVSFDFIQPQGGLVDGNAMRFEFNGDDDLWVFVDGVLVLDLGGIHSAYGGYIDFSTGAIVANGADNGTLTSVLSANGVDSSLLGTNTLKDYTQHKVDIFYLERGQGGSNCKMRFNIPPVPDGVVYVGKQISNTSNSPEFADSDFKFKVQISKWSAEKNAYEAYADYSGPYKVYEGTAGDMSHATFIRDGNTENGEFTLKHNQFAVFQGSTNDPITNADRYRVMEYDPDVSDIEAKYDIVVSGVAAESIDGVSGTAAQYLGRENLVVGERHAVVFTNSCNVENLYNLRILKELTGAASNDSYTMKVTLGGKPYTGDYYVAPKDSANIGEKKTASSDGTITIKAGEAATIQGVVWGSSFEVVEGTLDATYNVPTYGISNAVNPNTSGKAAGTIPTTVQTDKTTTVTVTNSRKYGSLKIVKTVEGLPDEMKNASSFSFTVTGPDNEPRQISLPVKNVEGNAVWETTIDDLTPGTYTVTETPTEIEGYRLISINGQSSSQQGYGSKTVSVNSSQTANADFVNTYKALYDLTITKTVDGNMGERNKSFEFQIAVTDGTNAVPVNGTYGTGANAVTITNGTFSLKNGQSVTIPELLKGYTYTVTENDYSEEGYDTPQITKTAGNDNSTITDREVRGSLTDDTTLEFTNTKNVDAPTGLHHNWTPYILMLAMSMCMAIGLIITGCLKMRRSRRQR